MILLQTKTKTIKVQSQANCFLGKTSKATRRKSKAKLRKNIKKYYTNIHGLTGIKKSLEKYDKIKFKANLAYNEIPSGEWETKLAAGSVKQDPGCTA